MKPYNIVTSAGCWSVLGDGVPSPVEFVISPDTFILHLIQFSAHKEWDQTEFPSGWKN